jgi:hypothetical protein
MTQHHAIRSRDRVEPGRPRGAARALHFSPEVSDSMPMALPRLPSNEDASASRTEASNATVGSEIALGLGLTLGTLHKAEFRQPRGRAGLSQPAAGWVTIDDVAQDLRREETIGQPAFGVENSRVLKPPGSGMRTASRDGFAVLRPLPRPGCRGRRP